MWKLTVLVLAIVGLNSHATEENEICYFIMDYPHGENRIHIKSTGETYSYYGASAKRKVIKNGIFSIEKLFEQIKKNLEPNLPREQRPHPQAAYGMVSLNFCSGQEKVYLAYNIETWAKAVFEKANDNIEHEGF
jgi:hypothetical protein